MKRPRIGLVMEGFALSRTGAVCYLLCSGLSIFGTDLTATPLAAKVEGYLKEELAGPGAVRATLHKHLS